MYYLLFSLLIICVIENWKKKLIKHLHLVMTIKIQLKIIHSDTIYMYVRTHVATDIM